ncbi:MAG: hypothetical protein ACOY32_06490 [Thermodesulfobacteriota bacterium]
MQTQKNKIIILTPARNLKKLANAMACCKPGAPAPSTSPDE